MVGPIVPSYDNLKITLVIPVIITTDNVLVSGGMCVTQPSKHSLRYRGLDRLHRICNIMSNGETWELESSMSDQSRVRVIS